MLGITGALGAAATGWAGLVIYKDQRWVYSPPYRRTGTERAKTLVAVYSRSGNTLAAAKEAAHILDADLLTIDTPDYPRSLGGQFQAIRDARARSISADLHHASFDVAHYESIVLCSPVWLFRPAVPLWAFVDATNFSGRRTFLLLTGNSGYDPLLIDEFGQVIESRNGRFAGHHFIRRGRVFWQRSLDDVRLEVTKTLAKHFDV